MNPESSPANRSLSPRSKLDCDTIVDAAITRIERHGLEELSARKLARDLGVEAMSLYHHIGNMENLRDLIVDRLLGSIPPATVLAPVDALALEARAYLDLGEAQVRSFVLIATRRWKGERSIATAMRSVGYFEKLGFEHIDALARARILGAYLNGAGLALSAWSIAEDNRQTEESKQVKTNLLEGLDLLLHSLASAEN